jgi:predicted ribosomally synthesized peptide with nif11-like leader
MSIAETERFAAALKSDEALQAEVANARADASHATPLDRVVALAASKGYAFTAAEAKEHLKAQAAVSGKALTDAELEGVAGGTDFFAGQQAAWLAQKKSHDAF